jgi:hypothetical protein
VNRDKAKFDDNNRLLQFDFEEWEALNITDPQAFEERRLEWCKQLIESAPERCHRRLSGLLFQINMEKRRSPNAMSSCLRLSGMMWEKFTRFKSEVQLFSNQRRHENHAFKSQKIRGKTETPQNSAKIIDFTGSPPGRALRPVGGLK